jgi:hydrogenase maturation protease
VSRGKCLVLGFGSDALSDDGLPLKLVNDLKAVTSQHTFTFETSAVGGFELLELLEGFDKVVLIDTQLTSRRKPGEIHEFTPANFEETFHLSCQHDVTFHEALRFAKEMGISMPDDIRIIAIEVVENKNLSFEFSREIEQEYQSILSYLCRILKSMSGTDD